MRLVQFRRPHRLWNRGEVAGFDPVEAERLIKAGVAGDPPSTERAAPQLREDGPTIEEWIDAGYPPAAYPPLGYAARSTPEEIKVAAAAVLIKAMGGQSPAPTSPTEPTAPVDPTEPTHPADPTDPTAPTEPTEPTEPASKTKGAKA